MPLKDNWETGDIVTADALNDVAKAVNNAAAKGATVYVEDYRDGVRTDNEIILAAFADLQSGGAIRFGQGVSYTITTDLNVSVGDISDVVIDGQGATLVGDAALSGTIFQILGSRYGSTNTTLTSDLSTRSFTLDVADTTGWSAGEMVRIYSSGENFNPDYTTAGLSEKAEMSIVKNIPDSTTIELDARTWHTYDATTYTVTAQRYEPMRHVVIRDLNIVGADEDNRAQIGLDVRYFNGLRLENISVRYCHQVSIALREGIDAVGIGCRAEYGNGGGGAAGGLGFTTILVNSVKWIGCYARRTRHGFDAHLTWDMIVDNCTAISTVSAGIGTHGSTDVMRAVNCTVIDCGGGIHFRGRNISIVGCHVRGTLTSAESATLNQPGGATYRSGILVGQGASTNDGIAGTNLVIADNVIDVEGPTYTGTEGDENGQTHGIYLFSPMVNARIVNNVIKGFPTHGIYSDADYNTGAYISGNVIDCSSQFSGSWALKCGILLKPAAGTQPQTRITISNNDISNGAIHSGIYIAGGATGTRSDILHIDNNKIGTCGTAKVYLDDQYYGDEISLFGNGFASTFVSYTEANFSSPLFIQDPGTMTVGVIDVSGSVTMFSRPGRQYVYLLNAGADATLPTAVGNTSLYRIKNCDDANITVSTTSTETIEGQADLTLLAGSATTVVSDGTNWRII